MTPFALPVLRRARLLLGFAAAAAVGAVATGSGTHGPVAREVLDGPVPARVLKVLDGDTLLVRARIWLGQEVEVKVRLAGLDAPELRSRCDAERKAARAAREHLRDRTAGSAVTLTRVHYGKFAGRVLARVVATDGTDLSAALLAAGLARPYDGGKRRPWCG